MKVVGPGAERERRQEEHIDRLLLHSDAAGLRKLARPAEPRRVVARVCGKDIYI